MRWGSKEWLNSQYDDVSRDGIDGWKTSIRASQRVRHNQVISCLHQYPFKRDKVLDIGCGTGIFTSLMKANFDINHLIGTDLSLEALNYGKEFNKCSFFIQNSLPDLCFQDNTFDCILALEVIYYLDENKRKHSLLEISRLLKEDGLCLVTGGLNENNRYLSEEKFKSYISSDLKIIGKHFHRSKFYYLIEDVLLKILSLDELFLGLKRGNVPYEFKKKKRTMFFLDNLWMVNFFHPLLSFFSFFSKKLLGSTLFFYLINQIPKTIFPNSSKSGVIYILRKETSKCSI